MTPMLRMAVGVAVILVTPRLDVELVRGPYGQVPVGYDALPDPLGWSMLVWGVLALPAAFPLRRQLTWAGVAALLVSVPLWFPAVQRTLLDVPELAWALSLPQGATLVLVCVGLLAAPQRDGVVAELPPGRSYPEFGLRTSAVALGAALLAPPLVVGAGLTALALPAAAAANIALVYLTWTLVRLHRLVPPGTGPAART